MGHLDGEDVSVAPWRLLLAVLCAACSVDAADPAAAVRVDVAVTPSIAKVGDELTLTLTAINEGTRVARWSSGCGLDLSFRVVDSATKAVEGPEYGVCTAELRQLSLEPKASIRRTVRWRLGTALAPGRRFATGSFRIQGLLGVVDRERRSGVVALLQIAP